MSLWLEEDFFQPQTHTHCNLSARRKLRNSLQTIIVILCGTYTRMQ